jgi:hypothetical protein
VPHLSPLLLLILLFTFNNAPAQQPDHDKLTDFPGRFLDGISRKAARIEKKLNEQTEKALHKMYSYERRLRKQLEKTDPDKAKEVFDNTDSLYFNTDQQGKKRRTPQPYIPALDTLTGAVKFLGQTSLLPARIKVRGELAKTLSNINGLEDRFKKAENVKNFLKERRQYLKERLQGTPVTGMMKKMNKDVYYYSQAINEYKSILQDKKKMERKALALLGKMPAFKKFMHQNSQLASLLNIPIDNAVAVSFTGLQSRSTVQQLISNTVPNAARNSQQFLVQQLGVASQQASAERKQLRIPEFEDNLGEMPDFKPNGQKTKSFLKRLEYGCDVQFGKVNRFLPATSELAVTVGYKLNDNGTMGIGSSYKLGLGSGLTNIRFTHQGFGLRSFIDWKIKGSVYLSGGYEKNYLPQLGNAILASGVTTLPASSWQESGLIGLSKKYSIGKNRKGTVQLLFDCLSFKNTPRSQPLIFRTGFKL